MVIRYPLATLAHPATMVMPAQTYRQAFGVKILNSAHPDIRRLKREGHDAAIHGNKFWNSSLAFPPKYLLFGGVIRIWCATVSLFNVCGSMVTRCLR